MAATAGKNILQTIKRAQQLLKCDKPGQALALLLKTAQQPHFKNQPAAVQSEAAIITGTIYYKQGNLQTAETYYTLAVQHAKQAGHAPALYNSLDNLAAVYINTQRFQLAQQCLQQAIEVKEKSGNLQDVGKGLLQLSGLLFQLEDFENGKQTLKKAGVFIRKFKQQQFFAHLYFAQAMQLKREKLFAKAVNEYHRCITYARQHHEWQMMVRAYTNCASILIDQKKFGAAEKDLQAALQLANQKQMRVDKLVIQNLLATVAIQQKKFNYAAQLLKDVEQQSAQYANPMVLRDTEQIAARLHEATGQPERALTHYKKYIEHYRQFYDNELSRTVLDIQAKYETEKRERELQQAKLQQAQSELKALRLQMNPHFVSNALGTIRLQVIENQNREAAQNIIRFTKLMRLMLDNTRQPVVSLQTNLELIHLYIQAEQARLNSSFSYSIKVSSGINPTAIYINGSILQPIIENAILHGLFHKPGKNGKLNIAISKNKTGLCIAVTDNGIGRKAAARLRNTERTSHATTIILETLAHLWKTENTAPYFVITDLYSSSKKPAGTQVKITLPLWYTNAVSRVQ